jgi:DNA-binding NtrC family response regulator
MKQAPIVACGLEPALAGRLQALAHERGLWIREVQHIKSCRNLVAEAPPVVLVLSLGKDVVQELTLLQVVSEASPETAVVVVGNADNPALAALAWDLGARCVMQPPQPMELVPEIVLRFVPAQAK